MKRRYGKLIVVLIVVLAVVLALDAYGRWKTAQQPQAQPSQMIDIIVVPDDPGGSAEVPASPQQEEIPPGEEDPPVVPPEEDEPPEEPVMQLPEDGSYDSKEDVALYIHLYGHLPPNYITKKQAEKLGWRSGSLEKYAPGCSIGGDRFGNYEGLLPDRKGRVHTECDIDTAGKSKRGAKRIIFSNDGLIYYTGDHYESFELLYGEE